MNETLVPQFTLGTHRLCSPEETLTRLEPLLEGFGITRCADITGLDQDLGVPTYTAIRPSGLVLQTGNGKGLTRAAARASALMEAIELFHAEHPEPERLQRASRKELAQRGLETLVPAWNGANRKLFYSDDRIIDWVRAEDLVSGEGLWIPAGAAYFVEPAIYATNTNGLAGGNHMVEATLHALYELIERDAVSRLVSDGNLNIAGTCPIVDPNTVSDAMLRHIQAKVPAAGSKLVLLWVPTPLPVHVFWAVLLNHRPFCAVSAFNSGYGAHRAIEVAASRAVTEAIQSRLTLIQAAREDIVDLPSQSRQDTRRGPAFRYFDGLTPDSSWAELASKLPVEPVADLNICLDSLVRSLADRGHAPVIRVSMEHAKYAVPVVKMIVASLAFEHALF